MHTIVVVDDEYYFRQAMKRYLSEWEDEYQCVGESKNGKEGLGLIRNLCPDIVLMDINMPVMGGLEVIQTLADENLGDKLQRKIILLTGYDEFEYARKAVHLGVFDYLLKPIDKQQLKKCLDKASSQIEAERLRSARIMELETKQYIATPMVKAHFVDKVFSADSELDWIEMEGMARKILDLQEKNRWMLFILDAYFDNKEHRLGRGDSFYYSMISNILTELFENRGIQCMTSVDKESLHVLVTGKLSVGELEAVVLEVQECLLDLIKQKLPLEFLISEGSAKEQLRDMGGSVHEANLVQKFMLMYRKTGIYNSSHINLSYVKLSDFFGDWSSQIILYIRTVNISAMESLVREAFSEMKKNEVRPEIILRRADDMVSCAYEVFQLIEENVTEDDKFLPMFPPKFSVGDVDQIQAEVLRYITDNMQTMGKRMVDKKRSLPVKVMYYIEENYHRYDLALAELSKVFGVSKTILCQQFKETNKMTIGEYILQIRMVRARKMFDEGYHNVAYVAEKCGYEDAGYFSKCFKKYFSISPRNYCEKRRD